MPRDKRSGGEGVRKAPSVSTSPATKDTSPGLVVLQWAGLEDSGEGRQERSALWIMQTQTPTLKPATVQADTPVLALEWHNTQAIKQSTTRDRWWERPVGLAADDGRCPDETKGQLESGYIKKRPIIIRKVPRHGTWHLVIG